MGLKSATNLPDVMKVPQLANLFENLTEIEGTLINRRVQQFFKYSTCRFFLVVLDASESACMVSHAKGQKIVENSFALGCNGQKEWLGFKLTTINLLGSPQVVFSAPNFGSKSVRSSIATYCLKVGADKLTWE